MSIKIDNIKDDHIRETDSRLAVAEEKLGRMENIIYGSITVIIAEAIGILFMGIKTL